MKLYSVLAIALLSTTVAMGQRLGGNHNEEVGKTNTGFGLKAGLNVSSVYNISSGFGIKPESEGITSWHAGAYGKLGLGESNRVAIQLEALYSRRGADLEYNLSEFDEPNERVRARFDYIDVPILFVYNIVGQNGTWSAMVGPQASLMITAKADGRDSRELDKNGLHTFEVAGVGGVQFGFKMFRVGARYHIGFTDIVKTDRIGDEITILEAAETNFKNHWGSFYVGVEF